MKAGQWLPWAVGTGQRIKGRGERLASQSEGTGLYLHCIQIAKFINSNTKISEFYCMIISMRKKRRKQLVWSFSSHKCQSSIKNIIRDQKNIAKRKKEKKKCCEAPLLCRVVFEKELIYG